MKEENQEQSPDQLPDAQPEQPADPVEADKPMPFGVLGISFLCSLLQYAAFVGFSMLVLMLIQMFAPE